MKGFINVSDSGDITLSSEFLDAFPNASARIADGKLIIENVCREMFVEKEFVKEIDPITGDVFYDDGVSHILIEFSSKEADIIDKCDIYRIAKYKGDAELSQSKEAWFLRYPLLTALQTFYLSLRSKTKDDDDYPNGSEFIPDFSSLYSTYLQGTLTAEEIVLEMFRAYELCGVFVPYYKDSYVKDVADTLKGISRDKIYEYLGINDGTMSDKDVMKTLKEIESKGMFATGVKSISQRKNKKIYDLRYSASGISYVRISSLLSDTERSEIAQNATSIHIDTLVSNFMSSDLSASSIECVDTDFGGRIYISDGVADVVCGMFRSDFLLGSALYHVLCIFGINEFRYRHADFVEIEFKGNTLYGVNWEEYGKDPDTYTNYNIDLRQVGAVGTSFVNGLVNEINANSVVGSAEECRFAFDGIAVRFDGNDNPDPSRRFIQACSDLRCYKVIASLVENLDILPSELSNINGDTILTSTYIDTLEFSGDPADVLSLDNEQSIKKVRIRAANYESLPRKYDEVVLVTSRGETIVRGKYAGEDNGVVGIEWLHSIGVRDFHSPHGISMYDVCSLPGATFRNRGGVVDNTDLFMFGNIKGYEDGVLLMSPPPRLCVAGITVNGAVISDYYALASALLLTEAGDISVSGNYFVRESDIRKLEEYMTVIQEAVQNYMFHTATLNNMYKSDPKMKLEHIKRAAIFLESITPQSSFVGFYGGETIFGGAGDSGITVGISEGGVVANDYNTIDGVSLWMDGSYSLDGADGAEFDGRYLTTIVCLNTAQETADVTVCDLVTMDRTTVRQDGCSELNGTKPQPREDKNEVFVKYVFTDEGDGALTVSYTATDSYGNDVTDMFSTMTIGNTFLHKELE